MIHWIMAPVTLWTNFSTKGQKLPTLRYLKKMNHALLNPTTVKINANVYLPVMTLNSAKYEFNFHIIKNNGKGKGHMKVI